jgi:hypothetical protein
MPSCIAAAVKKLSRFDAYLIHRSEVRAAKSHAEEERQAAKRQAEADRRARERRWKELKRPAVRSMPRHRKWPVFPLQDATPLQSHSRGRIRALSITTPEANNA